MIAVTEAKQAFHCPSYFEGQEEATRRWAYWKDGVQYVGSCGTTLAQALESIKIEAAKEGIVL